jgi:drug/metabolite transporter (DMT)-like permease
MGHEHRLRIRTLFTICVMVLCATIGDLTLKRGMMQIGAVQLTPGGILHAFLQTITSGTIWLAILFLLGFMASNMTALSLADYSYVMPASAFGYAVVTFVGVTVLGERVTGRRWLGVALICIGVFLVGRTAPRSTAVIAAEPPPPMPEVAR